MAVNWKNVSERVLSTLTQAFIGVLAAGAEYVSEHGVADWRTAVVAVGVPALLSLAKNLQAEVNKDLGVAVQAAEPQALTDAQRAALTVPEQAVQK